MNRAISQVAIVVIALPLILTACGPKSEDWECPSANQSQDSVMDKQFDPTTVRIHIDGTPSMRGFVDIPGSRYVQTLDLLDRAARTAFNSTQIKYYRFGITRDELRGEQAYKEAQSPTFYDRNNPKLQDAKLNAAITPVDNDSNDELSIIVTDLYQKESSKESPVIKLFKENYIQKGNAVGILAVKSEFIGQIYDVGKENKDFPYKTNRNNPEKFHPFYIILLGTYQNISSYFDQLKRNESSFIQNEQFVIFYPWLLNKPLVLNINYNDNEPQKGIKRLFSINDGHVLLKLKNPKSTDNDILKITNKYDGNGGIPYVIEYSRLPYTLLIEPNTKLNFYKIFRQENNNFGDTNSELLKFDFSNWKPQENEKTKKTTVSFVTEVNSIKETGVYEFAVDVVPSKLQDQDWWKQWSFGEDEATSWNAQPDNFDGSRTYNLLPFLQSLSDITLKQIESTKSPIGRFCYLIQKE